MLPEILKNATTPQGGARILDSMGVDKEFIDENFNKYSKYLTKIPGMNASNARGLLDRIKGAMRGGSTGRTTDSTQSVQRPLFDQRKYPKI